MEAKTKTITERDFESIATKLAEIVPMGLCGGIGEPEPGRMCVEAAVCYAMGLPHGDDPQCVGSAVRAYKIRLNDSNWQSNESRAKGMIRLAIAQLGSDKINQVEFCKRLVVATTNTLLPAIFGATFPGFDGSDLSSCSSISSCKSAADAAAAAAGATAYAAADAAANAAAAADAAANAAAAAAAAAANAAGATAYAAAAADAVYAAADDAVYAAAASAADAVYAAAASVVAADSIPSGETFLTMSADIALQILKDMKSPGCEYLHLVEGA